MNKTPPKPVPLFAWPWLGLATLAQAGAAFTSPWMPLPSRPAPAAGETSPPPVGATPSEVRLLLETLALRSYGSSSDGTPVLVCTPFALHGAAIADLASGHSIVERLLSEGITNLHLLEWRPADDAMKTLGIDDYLAALNVVIDELGGCADIVGLCQGGWLSLIYATRFPGKVRRLVLAGSPVDFEAESSRVSLLARSTPLDVFRGLVEAGGGRVLGHTARAIWQVTEESAESIRETLQSRLPVASVKFAALAATYQEWDRWALNLPGRYYMEVVERLYKHNELARDRFPALGRVIELGTLSIPLYLLAGERDDVVAPGQLLALKDLAPQAKVTIPCAPCSHLGLFLGAKTLRQHWPAIARWLASADSEL